MTVRHGPFPNKASAERKAERLRNKGLWAGARHLKKGWFVYSRRKQKYEKGAW